MTKGITDTLIDTVHHETSPQGSGKVEVCTKCTICLPPGSGSRP
jgi:hypothetical protein